MHDRTRMLPCRLLGFGLFLAEGPQWGPAKHAVGAQHAAQPEAPSSTFYGHPSYSHRTKRTITRAITRTDGAAPRPSERLVARGTTSQKWGGPPQTGRARTQRYTAPRHPAYARASSGDQWQSVAINGNRAAISGPHSQSRCNQWPSVAPDAPVLG